MNMRTRQEITKATRTRYQNATRKVKAQILTEFCQTTGYNRDYAAFLLRSRGKPTRRKGRPIGRGVKTAVPIPHRGGRPKKYGVDVQRVLGILWKRFDFLCGKRLVALIRNILPSLALDVFLNISEPVMRDLASLSPATADRLLAGKRTVYKLKGNTYTRSGDSLKNLIPIRTFDEWASCSPGYVQIDTVGHDGGLLSGECSFTLCLTDIRTGWTERYAMQNRAFKWVHCGLDVMREAIPFPIKHIHPDNGSEFINHGMIAYCQDPEHPIELSRSRAGKKNDNCYVEQKNFDTVRKLIGYARYATPAMLETMNELYRVHGLLLNYFYPSQKLIEKIRHGSKVTKRYDAPRSPADRLLAEGSVSETIKKSVRKTKARLNPLKLANDIESLSKKLAALLAVETSKAVV